MSRWRLLLVLAVPALVLTACGSRQDPAMGGLAPDEAAAMNDAAVMLDQNSVRPIGNDGDDQ